MAAESGKIDPMHQFEVTPLRRWVQPGRARHPVHQQRAVDDVAAIALWAVHVGRHAPPARPGPLAGRGRGLHRLYLEHDDGEYRHRRPQIYALCLLAVHVHPVLQPAWHVAAGRAGGCIPSPSPATSRSPAFWRSISFAIVLVVGFWRHGLHFFSLFVPHGTPLPMIPFIVADRVRVVHGPPVQPRPATVRRDDRGARPAQGAVRAS